MPSYLLCSFLPRNSCTVHRSSPHVTAAYSPDSHLNKKSRLHTFSEIVSRLRNPAHVISTRDLLPLTLSIPPTGQPVVLCVRSLGWRFYNSKSSIPNGSASPFGRITFRPFVFRPLSDMTTARLVLCPSACRPSSFAMAPGSRLSSFGLRPLP